MKKVLISDKIDEKILSILPKSIFVDYHPNISQEKIIEIISQYEALVVRSRTKVIKEIIDAGKNLKVIGRVGSGVDNIDIETAKKRKIKIVNAPGGNSNAVAELTIALMLSLLRNLNKAYLSMSQGLWLKKELVGNEIYGKTIGIIGYGRIGKRVARLVRAFGAKVYFYSRSKKNISLENLFKKSDIITLHLPLTNQTRNLIDKKLLFLMKRDAFIVNTSRGGIIVEKDLYQLLLTKKIAGAALDVFWEEPLPNNSPWRKLDNVILTPHLGASTKEALTQSTKIVFEKIIKILR